MSISAPDNFAVLRAWLRTVLPGDPPTVKITVYLRIAGRDEVLGHFQITPGETAESMEQRVVHAANETTENWDPVARAQLRTFSFAGNGSRTYTSRTQIIVINDDAMDDQATAGSGVPVQDGQSPYDLAKSEYLAKGVPTNLAVSTAQMPAFSMLAMLEMGQRTMGMQERLINGLQVTLDRVTGRLEGLTESVMEAQITAKKAELEADAERRQRNELVQDRSLKREMLKMFGTNLSKGLDLVFAGMSGLPPDDPAAQMAFLQGFIKKNPERARALAESLGLNGASGLPSDPQLLKPFLIEYATKNPDQAMAIGEEIMSALAEVTEKKAEEEKAKKAADAKKA